MIVSYLTGGETKPIDNKIEQKIKQFSQQKLMEIIYGVVPNKSCRDDMGIEEKYFIASTVKELLTHVRKNNPYLCDIDEKFLENILNKI